MQVKEMLSHQMLRGEGRSIIMKTKRALIKAIVTLAMRFYPEPTYENCASGNSKELLDIAEQFCAYEDNRGRLPLFRALWRIVIDEYEHDPYYRFRMDWVVEELAEAVIDGRWKPRAPFRKEQYWCEPVQQDFFDGRSYKTIVKPYIPREERELIKT